MKKFFSTILIIALVVVALGGMALIIRNNATPPDGGLNDVPDISGSETPVVKKDRVTVAGKEYFDGAKIFCVSGNNVFAVNFEEEYYVAVEWDNANKPSNSSLQYVFGGQYLGFDEVEYMKGVNVEKNGKRFFVNIPSIDDYLSLIHKGKPVDKIVYSEFSALKFFLTISYGDKTLNYVFIVDLTKCIPTAIILGSESICL